MTAFTFTKAAKQQEKLRLALDGTAGSGKTWTALIIGCELAKREGGRVAVIDSERSSAKKYASDFDFDHLTLPDFGPHTYMNAVRSAEAAGYAVIIIDSFSHAWEGVLEFKDNATARSRSKNSYTEGWREATPVHNELVDTVLRANAHVIATMRTKTEIVIEDGAPKKVGTKPIQREGVDFEFDVVGDMTPENTMVISKTRCSALAGQVIRKPDVRLVDTLWGWLNDGEAPEPLAQAAVVGGLTDRMNALPEKARREAKLAFKVRFGMPDHLTASQVADAEVFVAGWEMDAGSGGGGEAEEPVPPPVAAPTAPPPPPPPPPVLSAVASDDDKLSAAQSKALHSGMRKAGILPDDRHAWLTAMLDREIASASDVTRSEASRLIDRLLDGNPDEVTG